MIKRAIPSIIFTILFGCGRQAYIDPELFPFWEQFGLRKAYSGDIPGRFIDSLEKGAAACNSYKGLDKKLNGDIVVVRSVWNELSTPMKRMLVFHELGHCVLGLGHNETINEDGPASIMFPYIFDPGDREDKLIEEL